MWVQLNSALVFSTPHTQKSLGRSATVGAGALPLSRIFLALSASRCACRRHSWRFCASERDDDGSIRKRASSCLGVYARECGAIDPFLQCYKCIPHFCCTAQGCQVLLSDHRSSSGCRKNWSTVQKLHAIMHARLVLAGRIVTSRAFVFQVERLVLLEAYGPEYVDMLVF